MQLSCMIVKSKLPSAIFSLDYINKLIIISLVEDLLLE